MAKKKIVGSAGRFGVRYGKRLRETVSKIEEDQKKRHTCPKCNMPFVVRVSSGIWKCKKCGAKFTGLAYKPGR
jgi:large subunit ribosomal protein L37Ae